MYNSTNMWYYNWGAIVQKMGGYETKQALNILGIYGIFAVLFSIFIIQFNSLIGFAAFLGLFLFFGWCIVPNLMGVILSSLPSELRASGNSATNFSLT